MLNGGLKAAAGLIRYSAAVAQWAGLTCRILRFSLSRFAIKGAGNKQNFRGRWNVGGVENIKFQIIRSSI